MFLLFFYNTIVLFLILKSIYTHSKFNAIVFMGTI